jgi:nucleotide-binding universal stress UspA family protein
MRVLAGTDGSNRGLGALEEAVRRAEAAGDDLTAAVYAHQDESLSDAEAAVRDRLATLGVDVPVEVIDGDPGSRLVELAEREDYDQIVLPGGQVSPLGKINLTGVHEFVLLNARASVTLIR